ncbi:MAG TPA: phage portal protein [Anaerolineaceae bacterium]|nr:phage portal protein [Anaerolineaceae bacterium]
MFEKILNWIKGAFKMFSRETIKNKLGVEVAISTEMSTALETWAAMYKNQAEWLNDYVQSMNLPAAIAGELANLTTIELEVKVDGDNGRAAFLQGQINQVVPKLREMIEYGNAKGGLMLKPFPNGKGIDVDFIQADQFLPVAFDANGNITSCVFVDRRTQGKDVFTRLEWHEFDSNSAVITVRNLAFKSSSQGEIGSQINMESFEPWKDLQPLATISNVKAPLYGYYRFPMANNIDPTSPLGISCYSRAVDLIRQADELWSNLLWEFESGKRAIFADVLAFDRDDEGRAVLPDKRLYRALANSSGSIGEDGFFHEFSPEFREASILNGLDAVLKKIEYNCGLAYGTISDPQVESKTATEIKISKQRTYATVRGMQNALEAALKQLLYAMDVWTTLYKLAPAGAYSIIFDFDDSVVVDKDVQFQQDMRLVQNGLMGKVEFRMRNFGEDEETAKKMIALVKNEEPQEADLFKGT